MSDVVKQTAVKKHFDKISAEYDKWKVKNAYYYRNIKQFVKAEVRPDSRVLEIGCGTGEILHAVSPSKGVGVDISSGMIERAKAKFPQYEFYAAPVEEFRCDDTFDFIIMVDVVDHVHDIVDVFTSVYRLCHPKTKVILSTINPWWDPILMFMEKIGAKMPEGPHNFIEKRHIQKLLQLLDFSVDTSEYLLLFPKYIPLLSHLANTIGIRLWGLNKFSAVQTMTISPRPETQVDLGYGCSVIIPCYNEEQGIAEAISRVPKMGRHTEVIVVNDGSTDATSDVVAQLKDKHNHLKLVTYPKNRGKGYAMQKGFEEATQEIVMILDADLSVAPEELPRFFDALNKGKCEFVNGTRMVYPMEKQAMRILNHFGNKLFALLLSGMVRQDLSDTLCGTKAFYRKNLDMMKLGIDKWGDYDLIFGAAKAGHKIMEIPVHYRERTSGESKMKTLRHGLHLLRACGIGFKELVLRSRKG